jgi:hypothetical protein
MWHMYLYYIGAGAREDLTGTIPIYRDILEQVIRWIVSGFTLPRLGVFLFRLRAEIPGLWE